MSEPRPCEQHGWMPHSAHSYKIAPGEAPDAYRCPGYEKPWQTLSGVVQPEPQLAGSSESEHDCARDGHSLEMVETFDGGIVRMFCSECDAQWKVDPA